MFRWCCVALLLLSSSAWLSAAEEIIVEPLMIPMRDGIRLSAHAVRPAGDGQWPVLLEQRYANSMSSGVAASYAKIARHGYVVVLANFRGSQQSEGVWRGYRALGWGELKDGYDLVEWLAVQPWSTGKVGSFGGSQAGFAQNFLAVTQPPHLVAQYMRDTGLSLFHEGYRIGGAAKPERFKALSKIARVPEHNDELLQEWMLHPTYDAYWADEDCSLHFDKMNLPCFTLGSWYDFMCVGCVDSFVGRQHHGGPNSRGQQQLLIGPWLHGGAKGNKIAELTFPEQAAFDVDSHMVRWFDHYLKGIDNGVERDPTVRYYVMGAAGEDGAPGNVWKTASDWPIPSTTTPYYLHSDNTLTTGLPASADAALQYQADPLHPATIPAGAFSGAKDARDFEQQQNVLTFTTEELREPVEWTGKVVAEMFLSSDAPDTDLIVRVSDVYPDGRSMLVIDYVRRLRYREGYEKEVFLKPGEVVPVTFDVGWLSLVFNRGHRIRVTVASTGAGFYEPNPNTGLPITVEPPDKTQVATNHLQVNTEFASRILAPVIPQD